MKAALALLLAAGCGGADPTSDCSNVVPNEVPAEKDALFEYLDCRGYESLAKESSVHPATSAHGSMARVFINDALEQSLSSQGTRHPVGAASVKEIYTSDGSRLRGWAAMVKVDASGGGDSWYWFESYSTEDADSPVAAETGAGICTGCHSNGGRDYFLTVFPLQ